MKTTKKIVSVLLAVILVFGAMSTLAFAWTGDGTQEAKIYVVADKNTVAEGDTVTFSIIMELDENSTWSTFGNFIFSFCYNNKVLTPVNTTWGPTVVDFAADKEAAISTNVSTIKSSSTAAEQSAWDAAGINAMARVQCTKDNTTTYGSQGYWEPQSAQEVLATVECKVADGVAPGTAVHFDYYSGLSKKNSFYIQTIDTSKNNRGTNRVSATLYDVTDASASKNVVVGAAEEPFPSPSIVNPLKGQIRFNKDANGKFASFDVRAMAVISKTDFESKFAAGEAAEAEGVIKDIGFVFAAASNDVTLTYENVKKVVEGGETITGYAKKKVNFISTTLNSPNYVFTCMVEGMTAKDYEDSLLAVAYIAYADADGNAVYCYYPAVQEVSYKGLIDTYYKSTFGEAFAK